jgi:hypothetical protein
MRKDRSILLGDERKKVSRITTVYGPRVESEREPYVKGDRDILEERQVNVTVG